MTLQALTFPPSWLLCQACKLITYIPFSGPLDLLFPLPQKLFPEYFHGLPFSRPSDFYLMSTFQQGFSCSFFLTYSSAHTPFLIYGFQNIML